MTDNRDAVVERYSSLARLAAAGGEPVDVPDGTEIPGCGSDAYSSQAIEPGTPEGAVRASLACGNPVAVADLRPGEVVLDHCLTAQWNVISNCVINLSEDKPRALAEAVRVLRPGGRFGVTDVLASAGLDPQRRAVAERAVGCSVGTLTEPEYRDQLLAAGFSNVTITSTHVLADGLYSAIIQARTPAG